MDELLKYAEEIIMKNGGCAEDVEQITDEIEENGYTTKTEVDAHLRNYYL